MLKQTPDLFAAIHVGSENVSLQIVEYRSIENINIVEQANTQVTLGEEVFKTGKLGFKAVGRICELLKGYRRLLADLGVREYRLVATTAVREAENEQYIVDQIKLKTGLTLQIVDLIQEIFYKYAAVFKQVQNQGLDREPEGVLFVDISSGGLGITLLQNGCLTYQQNIHAGLLRIKESFEQDRRESAHFTRALEEYICSSIAPVRQELGCRRIKSLVLSGLETGLLLAMLGRPWDSGGIASASDADLLGLYEQVTALNLPQIMERFSLSEHKAEMALPTIVLCRQILTLFAIGRIVMVNSQMLDGIVLLHVGDKQKEAWLETLEEQVVSLARTLGGKYGYDVKHSKRVEEMALALYDRMNRMHGLGKRERLLLKLAAILHDIGKFVSLRRHYFYSHRLILSFDILGISEAEKGIIANAAFYHGNRAPSSEDAHFFQLPKKQQVTVAKLAAMLKLADALDRSHNQKISDMDITYKSEELIVTVVSQEDISIETWSFEDRADFFESVFGIRAILKRRAG